MVLTVSFFDVMSGLVAALALLSCICLAAMRGQRTLAWLATALVIGALEMQAMKLAGHTGLLIASVTITVPLAHWCFTQAIRCSLALPATHRWIGVAIVALAALSLGLLALGADDFTQALPFQIAALLALGDGIAALLRERRRSVLNYALLPVQTLMTIMLTLRIPVLPVILGGTSPFTDWTQSLVLGKILTGWLVIGPLAVALLIAKVVSGIIAQYRDRCERDDLTGLLNRGAFHRALDAPAARTGAVVLCDIDHFKAVNDRYGHAVGDDVIRTFARMLRRHADQSARIGGEEFALLLPGATAAVAAEKAEAIRRYFHAFRHPAIGADCAISASFGVAMFGPGEPPKAALIRADAAQYEAKHAGRNRVHLAAAPGPAAAPPQLWAA